MVNVSFYGGNIMRTTAIVLVLYLPMASPIMAEDVLTNDVCPVMIGNKIDPNITVEYRGKKVRFCCMTCKNAFLKSPEKYLSRFPKFADSTTGERDSNDHEGGHSIVALHPFPWQA
jgi:YHS domain-containing protein